MNDTKFNDLLLCITLCGISVVLKLIKPIYNYGCADVDLLRIRNGLYIDGYITKTIINNAIAKINNFNFMNNPTIYIIIDSNGGDYLAGFDLISNMEMIKTKNITFNCYALQAKSLAFDIFQYCDKRFVTPDAVLYQHNANVSISLTGTFDTFDNFYKNQFENYRSMYGSVNKFVSNRIKLNYNEYLQKITDVWNIEGGKKIIENNLADEIATLSNLRHIKYTYKL